MVSYENGSNNFSSFPLKVKMASSCLTLIIRSRIIQYFLLFADGFAAGIQLGRVYLQEVQVQLRSLDPSQILWDVPQNNCCPATYLSSHKPSKWNEPDMQGTVREIRMNS